MSEPLFKTEDFRLLNKSLDPGQSVAYILRDNANTLHEARCPYKPRIDNDNGNEYAQVMALKNENARLREALKLAQEQLVQVLERRGND